MKNFTEIIHYFTQYIPS